MSDTFNESWYRIAGENIRLRTGIVVRRQNFRGERWFVLENPLSNQYFRLRPAAYEFVARLGRRTTVGEAWEQCLERFPDEAPGQGEVVKLLSQLYQANLLEYDLADDARQLFERGRKRKTRELRARLTNIMFMRFPLINPDRFLVKTMPLVGPLLSRAGAIAWLIAVGYAVKLVIDNFPTFTTEASSVLAPTNLIWLYVAMAVTKTFHEFGHAYMCRKFGGEVHTMGIMLLIFTPIPYVDATSSWSIRSKWKRLLVGAAGMIVELFLAAIAVVVWANTSPGLVHSLAYNMIFIASVSTVLFNINPLLRFDGYYMLSDLVDVPNLHAKATGQLKYFCKRYLFGLREAKPQSETRRGAFWLTAFAIASLIYRLILFSGIVLFVADRFLLLGLIMAVLCISGWIVVPLCKLVYYLASSPELARTRSRAIAVTAGGVAAILAFLQFVPFPEHLRAPGIFEASSRSQVVAESPGEVVELFATDGAEVEQGQALLRMSNRELELAVDLAALRVRESEARLLQAMRVETADLQPLREKLAADREQLAKLQADQERLTVRARHAGIFVAPALSDALGRHFAKGAPLGLVVDPSRFEFVATVPQDDADRLFTRSLDSAELRIPGQAEGMLRVENVRKIPAEQSVLPSPVLGWAAGGEIETDAADPEGRVAKEGFFTVRADVPDTPEGRRVDELLLLHGRSAKIRFDIGHAALLPRWSRRFRQLLQRRFQI